MCPPKQRERESKGDRDLMQFHRNAEQPKKGRRDSRSDNNNYDKSAWGFGAFLAFGAWLRSLKTRENSKKAAFEGSELEKTRRKQLSKPLNSRKLEESSLRSLRARHLYNNYDNAALGFGAF